MITYIYIFHRTNKFIHDSEIEHCSKFIWYMITTFSFQYKNQHLKGKKDLTMTMLMFLIFSMAQKGKANF